MNPKVLRDLLHSDTRLTTTGDMHDIITEPTGATLGRNSIPSGLPHGQANPDVTKPRSRPFESSDAGETFSGVDVEEGVVAAGEFAALATGVGPSAPVAALAWLSQLDGVSTVISGAERRPGGLERTSR